MSCPFRQFEAFGGVMCVRVEWSSARARVYKISASPSRSRCGCRLCNTNHNHNALRRNERVHKYVCMVQSHRRGYMACELMLCALPCAIKFWRQRTSRYLPMAPLPVDAHHLTRFFTHLCICMYAPCFCCDVGTHKNAALRSHKSQKEFVQKSNCISYILRIGEERCIKSRWTDCQDEIIFLFHVFTLSELLGMC
jgi:hypothetical protein